MGGSSGTARVASPRTGRVWQACGERWSTGFVFFRASAMVRVLRCVTARSRIFSHRTIAHGPHKTASSAEPTVRSPAADRIVATPPAIEMSPAVRVARCLYGTPASWDSTTRQRSRRPNIPAVQPCEGSPRSAASTASLSSFVGWKGSPVGRPRAARTATDSPGLSRPAAAWWWSMAATRRRRVAGAAGHSCRNSTTVCGSAYASDWALFTDHCAVNSIQPLPADPQSVVDFLQECPAAPATRRRRVAAIDHHHAGAGHPRPGESVAVRAALGRPTGEPFQPTKVEKDAVEAALRGLPSHGWTAGMFGRRDRCLVVLSQLAGVPYRHLATLPAGAISIADGVAAVRSPAGR